MAQLETAQTVSDKEGHYDIDGVSYAQDEGVIVASDASKSRSWRGFQKLLQIRDALFNFVTASLSLKRSSKRADSLKGPPPFSWPRPP